MDGTLRTHYNDRILVTPAQQMGIDLGDTRPRILYVEDNAINSKVVRYGLRQTYHVSVAVDARQARLPTRVAGRPRAERELPEQELPDYARDLPTLDIPIVIVTAFTERYTSHAFADAGADFHMSKPVNLAALLGWLDEHARH